MKVDVKFQIYMYKFMVLGVFVRLFFFKGWEKYMDVL